MTPKQRLFVAEYMVGLNATQAAIRAGYSADTAYSIGSENLRKPQIEAEIERLTEQRATRLSINADYVVSVIYETVERCRQSASVIHNGETVPGMYHFDARGVLNGTQQLAKYLDLFGGKNAANMRSDVPACIIVDL